jgi:multiple sugar transport system substrate-binding protein
MGPMPDRRRVGDGVPEQRRLDPDQPIPIYFQLKTLLLEDILSGRYGPDDRLPTEHELCARYGISRTPVNRALSELADEGMIIRRRRHGTYVNPHALRRHPDRRELRVLVPEGAWEAQIAAAAPPGIRISVATVALPRLHHALTHALAEGHGPDLAVVDSVRVAELSAAGFLWPLDELDGEWVTREYERDFLEPFVTANRHATRPVAVQAEADVAGIWYCRRQFEALGLSPPDTWEKLLLAGRRLKAAQEAPFHPLALPGGSRGGETTAYGLLALLAANGVTVLDDRAVTLDTAAAVETLKFLQRLVRAGIVTGDVVAYEWDRPIRLLAHGQASMSLGGSYDGPALAAHAGRSMSDLWDHYGFAAIPAGPHGAHATLAGGMVYTILRQAAYPDLAMRLLERVTSPEACARMARSTAQIPPRRSAVELVASESPFLMATAGMLASAAVRPNIPAYPRVSAQLQAMLEAVLTAQLTPAAAIAHAADMISAVTGLPVTRRDRARRSARATAGGG